MAHAVAIIAEADADWTMGRLAQFITETATPTELERATFPGRIERLEQRLYAGLSRRAALITRDHARGDAAVTVHVQPAARPRLATAAAHWRTVLDKASELGGLSELVPPGTLGRLATEFRPYLSEGISPSIRPRASPNGGRHAASSATGPRNSPGLIPPPLIAGPRFGRRCSCASGQSTRGHTRPTSSWARFRAPCGPCGSRSRGSGRSAGAPGQTAPGSCRSTPTGTAATATSTAGNRRGTGRRATAERWRASPGFGAAAAGRRCLHHARGRRPPAAPPPLAALVRGGPLTGLELN